MARFESLRGLLPEELLAALENETERSDTGLVRVGLAEVNIVSSAATTTNQEPNFTKVLGTYDAPHVVGFTHLDGVLTKIDPETRIYHLSCSITAVASANDVYVFRTAVNGVGLAKTEQRRLITGVTDVGSISITSCLNLSLGDTLELCVAREGVAPATCTAIRLHFSVLAIQ